MANSYDITKLDLDPNKVRLLISDTDTAAGKYIFDDEEIDALIALEGSVLLAAARALEVIAANEVLVQKRITLLDLSTDGPSEANALMKLAQQWRDSEADASGDAGFDIAQVAYDQFTTRDILLSELLRDASA